MKPYERKLIISTPILCVSSRLTDGRCCSHLSPDSGKFPQEIIDAYPQGALEFSAEEWKIVHGSTDLCVYLRARWGHTLTETSFGLNTYGTKYATGKRYKDIESATPVGWFFGRVELVERDKEGKLIGVKGENGHPYAGESRHSSPS